MRFLLFAALAGLGSTMAYAENDLSPFTKVSLSAEVYQYPSEDDDGKTVVDVVVDHNYTNTLSCDLSIPIRVRNVRGAIPETRIVSVSKVMIFPDGALGSKLHYPVTDALKLEAGQVLEPNALGKGSAMCSGWDINRTPLPKEMCQAFNPKHNEACQMLTDRRGHYPLMSGALYLGACACP